jgi:nucleoside-diphosphate-sugar epimerase
VADSNTDFRSPVLILGASGFIGSRLVTALEGHPRLRPVAASRRAGAGRVVVDALDAGGLARAMQDADFVINCIAGSDRDMVASTQNMVRAALGRRPARMIYFSSMAVYGSATGTVDEDHAAVMPVSGYGEAKIASERLVNDYVGAGGDAVILRPTCVFGPHSRQWTLRLARLLNSFRIGDLGAAGDGCCNLVYTDDLVAATVAALEKPSARGQRFNLSSTQALTWNQFLMAYGRALGAVPVRRVSGRSLRLETKLLAPFRRVASKMLDTSATEAITPSLAGLFAQDIQVRSDAAVRELGMPQTPVAQMIASAVRWLQPSGQAAMPSMLEPVR